MAHVHLSRDLLEAAEGRRVSAEMLGGLMVDHLAGRCPTCAEELRRWRTWRRLRTTPAGASGIVEALRILLGRTPGAMLRAEAARGRAALRFEELRRLPVEERRQRIERDPGVERTELAELCLREARACLPARPSDALEWAALAQRLAERPETGSRGGAAPDLLALALAHRANGHRALRDLERAGELFQEAAEVVREHRITDLATLAEILSLEASHHRARRCFPAAKRCLDDALLLCNALADRSRIARVRITLGTLAHAQGDHRQALAAIEAADDELSAEADPRLSLAVRHNRAFYLCELGRFLEAADILDAARHLYELFDDPWTGCRRAWLEGKVARGRGRRSEAEERLRAARRGFLAAGSAYDAALVSLELAALHLELGHTLEVQRLAREMVSTFRTLRAHREALQAARLFAGAAAHERVSLGLVGRLVRYFHHARHDPHFAFEARS